MTLWEMIPEYILINGIIIGGTILVVFYYKILLKILLLRLVF